MFRNCNCNKCYSMNNYDTSENNDNVFENSCYDLSNNNYMDTDDCMCGFDEEESLFPSNPAFGQSYVPWHTMNKTFVPQVGFKMGTIFPELVSPYMPCDSMRQIQFIQGRNTIGEGCNDERR